ncbi:Aspartyl/glutamyl-tRNA amidotransferase subunit B [Gigaspora rosea]|uniref:Glutamyl-tRNA(Gln) amidotransferase subunit B, mitochondrial n=1 Tax=Gigaspora rosea TaxID=44941 RepID=A0A397UEM1_9GLOM|nr:Aspartyl/glutamyl-tRNA amidotransferase subunit B [Gigaspora rosea]
MIKTFVTTYLKKTCNGSNIKRHVTSYQYSTQIRSERSILYKSNKWEAIIGLEVHAQLNSKTKLFSLSSASFNEPVNTNVSVIDAAFPGTLPKLNAKCVELAVAASLALSGNVQLVSSFDRKQYFYPDLPPGYQITQHYAPISLGGKIFLNNLDGLEYDTVVRIKQIQLEQDTGKSIHDIVPGMTLIDLNRAGTGLIEIVTEPDMRTSKEAGLTVKKLQAILRAIGSSDGNMEEGSLRCDVNVSVHEHETPYGTRCEIKNLNSIKFLMAAIDVEIERQIKELENGNKIVQETRGFDVLKNKTFRLRTKETATDYRYMPEPDLSPLILNKDYITRISNNLPELPDDLKTRIMKQYGIPLHDVIVLMNETGGVKYFEKAVKNRNPQHVSNWITHELFGLLHARNIKFSQNPVSALQLGSVVDCVDNGDITGKVGKKILEKMISGDSRLASIIIQDEGLRQLSDINELEKICQDVILQNPEQLRSFKGGKQTVFAWFVGQVMNKTKGQANPKLVNEILRKLL